MEWSGIAVKRFAQSLAEAPASLVHDATQHVANIERLAKDERAHGVNIAHVNVWREMAGVDPMGEKHE